MARCILENSIATTTVSYPFHRGWLDTPEWLRLAHRVSSENVDEETCALIDAVEATRLFETHAVISDLAVVSTHFGPIAMRSDLRPDEIENAVVRLDGAGPVAEAVARATVHQFYGVDILDWTRGGGNGHLEIVDDERAFQIFEDHYSEDLVRAWFILTSLALPTHVFVAPISVLQNEPESIEAIQNQLFRSIDVSNERRREVRRNLSDDFELDRELITEYLGDQKLRLTKSGRKGWLDLLHRVARAMNLPDELRPVMHSLSGPPRDSE